MKRTRSGKEWQAILEGYDSNVETVSAYCARIGISESGYYHHREKMNASISDIQIVPVTVQHNEKQRTAIEINHTSLVYDDKTITDESLKRIIRICNEL